MDTSDGVHKVHRSMCFTMRALSPTAAMIQALCWTLCKHHPLNQTRRVLSTVLVIVYSWGHWEVSNITGATRKWSCWICNQDIKPIIVSWWPEVSVGGLPGPRLPSWILYISPSRKSCYFTKATPYTVEGKEKACDILPRVLTAHPAKIFPPGSQFSTLMK